MSRPAGYSVADYGDMVIDEPRAPAYAAALRQAVTPGCTVADIGAGTGFLTMLACQSGAARVHAIEPHDAVEVARSIARANGFADRVVFHREVSTRVELPSPADVIVSDLRSVLPLFQQHIPSIVDARARLLAPGGVLIPRSDTIRAALAEDDKLAARFEQPWLRNAFDLDMSAGHEVVVNAWRKVTLRSDQLVVAPRRWAVLDYRTIEDPDVAGSMTWSIEQPGTAHGLAVWFDTGLDADHGFSNAPGEPELIYGQAFFPWRRPVELAPGDTVTVDLRADLVNDSYIWSWSLELDPADGSGRQPVTDRHSTFYGTPMAPGMLRRRAGDHRPVLDADGRVDRFLLTAMDGDATLEEIARRAAAEFPGHFPTWTAALARAGDLATRYGS